MSIVSVQEVKRRGMSAVDQAIEAGPVHLVKSNRPEYVVMTERDYQELMSDLAEARLAASERDLVAGRIRRGGAPELMAELLDKHSVSLTYSCRIVLILRVEADELVLLDVGSHDDVYRG